MNHISNRKFMTLKSRCKQSFRYKLGFDSLLFYSAFPDGCLSFYGPHSIGCLGTVWKTTGCLVEGFEWPARLPDANIERLNELNLR